MSLNSHGSDMIAPLIVADCALSEWTEYQPSTDYLHKPKHPSVLVKKNPELMINLRNLW